MDSDARNTRAQARFNNFASTVGLLTGARLFLACGPDDLQAVDYPGTPPRLIQAYRSLASDARVRDLPASTVLCLKPVPRVVFAFVRARGDAGLIVLGPYQHYPASSEEAAATLKDAGAEVDEESLAYVRHLPVILHTQAVGVVISVSNILNDTDTLLYVEHKADAPRNVPSDTEGCNDGLAVDPAQAKIIEQRYEVENRMLDAIVRADEQTAIENFRELENRNNLSMHRNPDLVRDRKNTLIILNTLMRKSLERAHVHPSYIDAISTRWGLAIERSESLDDTLAMPYAMLKDYCAQVRSYTLEGYTPNVRAAITHILRHISDSDLSLTSVSSALGLNPTYLSHQFNQEVGMSMPTYVTRLRIDRAQNLLRQDRSVSISSVAREVGYLDLSYFSKRFRAIVGCSPSEYRDQQRGGSPNKTGTP